MATALVTQIAYAVQTLFDPAGTAGRLVDLGKLANYGLLTSFTPAALFTTGVNGAWYDPSDLNTLFQDAAGTTPVTAVEQPVGLTLDKSKGLVLGSELVTNGDFSSGTTGWTNSSTGTGTFTVSSGAATIIGTDGSNRGAFSQNIGAVAGRLYKVSFNATITSGAGSFFGSGPGSAGGAIANGLNTYYIASASNGAFFVYTNSGGGNITIDNISVRELPGNHAFNSSGNSANFPVLSARYNLLTKSEQFDDAVWVKTGTTVTANYAISPDGNQTADRLVFTGTSYNTQQLVSGAPATTFTFSVWLRATSGTAKARLNITAVGLADYFGSDLSLTETWTLYTFTKATTTAQVKAGVVAASTGDLSDILVWGADLRVANDAMNQPAYQRVNTATDYDTVGFKPYLRFNGTNQWLQTNSIDFTYGDKMFVSAGVRKTVDTDIGIICEFSASASANNSSFGLRNPSNAATPNSGFVSRGTIQVVATSPSSYAAPITNVISGIGDISAPNAALRVNSIQVAQSTATQGTGNYGNYPLYIGARAGTSLWFNGRLYGLVVAGKQASASEITNTEAWLNQKTGAY